MKKGISIIVLVVTIIVLIVLTISIILVGGNTPQNAELALFYSELTSVQDAVTLKMLNNMSKYATTDKNMEWCKYIGIIDGYTEQSVNEYVAPSYNELISTIEVAPISKNLSESLSIDKNRLGIGGDYYIDSKGVVYHKGFYYQGATYYTKDLVATSNQPIVEPPVVEVITIGDLVTDYTDYGKTVSYSANGVTDWKVFYKQTINDEDYVYLIASNKLIKDQIPVLNGLVISSNGNVNWNSGINTSYETSIANEYFMANWNDADYTTNSTTNCVSQLLNTENWTELINQDYSEYIVGAIGTPTLEMWVASWNQNPLNQAITLSVGTKGYNVDKKSYYTTLPPESLERDSNMLYFPDAPTSNLSYKYWLAAPANSSDKISRACGNASIDASSVYPTDTGLRPVVCLKSNIPAYWTDESLEDSITLGIKE